MKIYDKRSDYYDHVVQPTDYPVYMRKEEELILDITKQSILSLEQMKYLISLTESVPVPRVNRHYRGYSSYEKYPDISLLGFCGKLYPCLLYTSDAADE